MKGLAVFDIDGTLVEGLIIQEFPRHLSERGFFDRSFMERIDGLVSQYRAGRVSYNEIGKLIPVLYASGITGQRVDIIEREAEEFTMEHLKANIRSYTSSLIDLLRDRYYLVALSGSPIEAVREMASLGFDEIYGTTIKTSHAIYVDEVELNLIIAQNKEKILEELREREDIGFHSSIAFGDTEADTPILRVVKQPIALHPNRALRRICEEEGWAIYEADEEVIPGIKKLLR